MIILEGPDGAGKTKLAWELSDTFSLEYRRPPEAVLSSSKGPQGERGLIDWWLQEIDKARRFQSYAKGGVYDRTTFISDVIYRLAHGGKPQGTAAEMGEGVSYLMNYGFMIFCLPPFEKTLEVVQRSDRERLEGLDEDRLHNIWWSYHYWAHVWWQLGPEATLIYDWTNRDEVFERVTKYRG